MADLLVSPPVDQFRLLDFGSRNELIRLGYEWTSGALNEWLDNNAPIKARFCTP